MPVRNDENPPRPQVVKENLDPTWRDSPSQRKDRKGPHWQQVPLTVNAECHMETKHRGTRTAPTDVTVGHLWNFV